MKISLINFTPPPRFSVFKSRNCVHLVALRASPRINLRLVQCKCLQNHRRYRRSLLSGFNDGGPSGTVAKSAFQLSGKEKEVEVVGLLSLKFVTVNFLLEEKPPLIYKLNLREKWGV